MSESRLFSESIPAVATDMETFEKQRSEQAWRYAGIVCVIWVFMTGLFWLRSYQSGSVVCLIQTVLMLSLMYFHRGMNALGSYRRFTNLFLGFSCTVLLILAVMHPEIDVVLFFLPLGIVMAAQILGARDSVLWLLVNLTAFLAYCLVYHGSPWEWPANVVNKFVLSCGVALGTFLSCLQLESFYRRRSKTLVELSKGLHRLATTDSLTGLKNRHQFRQQLESQLKQSKVKSSRLALLMIDMNGFKAINDNLGHLVGDDTLSEIATRLTQVTSSVYRIGGDEFCVIATTDEEVRQVEVLAQSIHNTLCQRYSIDDAQFQLGTSIGIAVYPDHAETASELLSFADTAMYHAKDNRLGVCGYQNELTAKLVASRKMQNRLSSALERDEFLLVYQPQIEIETGKVVGVEALLRWNCNGSIVSPGEFVPLLEKSRLIIPVGRWIVREACRQLGEWTRAGYDIGISLNVSAVQFHDSSFVASVAEAVEEFGSDASKLDFEVTESVLIEDVHEAVDRLRQLKTIGATISIDDFGTGYSSLAYLQRLPLDKLKIDRTFVKGIPSKDDGTIAASVVVLAKSLGLRIVAEGVETEKQLEFLAKHSCDQYQGFLHSRPMGPLEVEQYFSEQNLASSDRKNENDAEEKWGQATPTESPDLPLPVQALKSE